MSHCSACRGAGCGVSHMSWCNRAFALVGRCVSLCLSLSLSLSPSVSHVLCCPQLLPNAARACGQRRPRALHRHTHTLRRVVPAHTLAHAKHTDVQTRAYMRG